MLAGKLEKKLTEWIRFFPSHLYMLKCYETYLAWPVPGPPSPPLVSKGSSTRLPEGLELELISGDHLVQHQEELELFLMYKINYQN